MTVPALVLALAAGAVVGWSLGALGAGGSILTVPALIYLLGFTPAEATTASLLIVTAMSLTALAAYARARQVRWKAGSVFAAAGLLPAAAAGALATEVPPAVLTGAFATVAAAAAAVMFRGASAAGADGAGKGGARPLRTAGAGAGLGALTGLLGVGGGFLAVPALRTVLALPIRAAVGTSLLVIVVNALAALAARGDTADGIHWAALLPFAGTAVLGAWDGRRLAARVPAGVLQRVFAAVLLAVAAVMLADALP
ncbi:sulfite exporter TauE/SafE family protein [Streptomyces verrucosisporus]|uniref:sulfite exporter TauE/SafE family protein n=1 Tax=Streptomyces verrucosisporus TaxID=1695161 RepID=UPI0019D2FDC3|nr:sulfite exporter TauE/SafE family protein [Streptomyces verrucosisporus]MBN3930012.1 sulfite exporter TauE/SafE family protein [Streptomyces verrucosisporus]